MKKLIRFVICGLMCVLFFFQICSADKGLEIPYMAFAYGSLDNINNKGNVDESIKVLSNFPYVICAEPGDLYGAGRRVVDGIKNKVKIFGYINMGETPRIKISKLKKQIDRIAATGYYGVFIDQFGYDFKETRARQNEIVKYAHDNGLVCFVNAWFIDDALGSAYDKNYNPLAEKTALRKGDWYLLESYMMNNSGYDSYSDNIFEKSKKAKIYKKYTEINIACLSYKRDAVSWQKAENDIKLSYMFTLLNGFDGWWFADDLANDSFLYGKKPIEYYGSKIKQEISFDSPNKYFSKTDLFNFYFDTSKYPPISYEIKRGGL